jgi:hypothetical protein
MPGGVLGIKYNGRFVSLLISHVGIQSEQIQSFSQHTNCQSKVKQWKQKFNQRRIIVGISDLDVVKGKHGHIQTCLVSMRFHSLANLFCLVFFCLFRSIIKTSSY